MPAPRERLRQRQHAPTPRGDFPIRANFKPLAQQWTGGPLELLVSSRPAFSRSVCLHTIPKSAIRANGTISVFLRTSRLPCHVAAVQMANRSGAVAENLSSAAEWRLKRQV